jgi:hypothetical protein
MAYGIIIRFHYNNFHERGFIDHSSCVVSIRFHSCRKSRMQADCHSCVFALLNCSFVFIHSQFDSLGEVNCSLAVFFYLLVVSLNCHYEVLQMKKHPRHLDHSWDRKALKALRMMMMMCSFGL